jgi:hypothetical protein
MGGVVDAVSNVVSNPVSAVLNPVGTVANAVGGSKLGFLANPTGALSSQLVTGRAFAGAPIKAQPGSSPVPTVNMSGPGYDETGRPLSLQWDSRLGSDGTIGNQYKMQIGDQPYLNTEALDQLRSYGTSQGMSPWGQQQMQIQNMNQAQQMNQANQMQNTANSKAFNDLAMRGGSSAAGRERIATNNARQGVMGLQNINRQGDMDRLNIGAQDQQQKMDVLKSLPGMELQSLNPQFQYMDMQNKANEFNNRASLDEINKQRQFALDQYKSAMSAWGSNKAADAQIAALNQQGQNNGLLGGLMNGIF